MSALATEVVEPACYIWESLMEIESRRERAKLIAACIISVGLIGFATLADQISKGLDKASRSLDELPVNTGL